MSAEQQTSPTFRPFRLQRDQDVSGISGTGIVAEGILFSDGWCVTHWLDQPPMNQPKTDVWHTKGTDGVERIHGHDGKTHIVWADEACTSSWTNTTTGRSHLCVERGLHLEHRAADGTKWTPILEVSSDGPSCQYCGADCSNSRSYDGGGLYACGRCSHRRAAGNREAASNDGTTIEDFIVAVESALKAHLLPTPGMAVVERTRNAVVMALDPLVAQLRRERDLAIAHDRQPYPTQWAYDQACKALNAHRERADEAEANRDRAQAKAGRAYALAERWLAAGDHGFGIVAAAGVELRETLDGAKDDLPPNQGPLTGIEVRDPCPFCTGTPMIPRREIQAHMDDRHQAARAAVRMGDLDGQLVRGRAAEADLARVRTVRDGIARLEYDAVGVAENAYREALDRLDAALDVPMEPA